MNGPIKLLDLLDELILFILNKVKPTVFLLSSMIKIDNKRLKSLVFHKNHLIDLTFDYYPSSHKSIIDSFYTDVMSCIISNALHGKYGHILCTFVHSSIIQTIKSFELDEDCTLTDIINENNLLMKNSNNLTDIRISLHQYEHFICLLNQFGSQLHTLIISMMYVNLISNAPLIESLKNISCPNLK
ncbi:hypothetical protein I4U23_004875 [Adineta vaga]|nr:hypothetical protein I4U23_004875 [Adineta vaga]